MPNDFLYVCAVMGTFGFEKTNGDQLAWMSLSRKTRKDSQSCCSVIGEEKRFSGTNQKRELPRPFGTGPLKGDSTLLGLKFEVVLKGNC